MNCSFCYTGTQGLKRNLASGEIVGQYLAARRWLRDRDPSALPPSIVFMGQGEPLHNVDAVEGAIRILNDSEMGNVGHRQMTLSTVGFLPALPRLRDFPKVNVALSLHSPFEEERRELIPVNDRFPLSDVLRELDGLPLLPRQFVTYEYLLIRGFNMSPRHAEALAGLLGHRKALVNLIPFNPFPGARWERPSAEEVDEFRAALVVRKLRVMVRTTKGAEILAACGQLKVNKLARKHGTE
jgi:23S rRNA (adenine2503-C2)-methyltransferase